MTNPVLVQGHFRFRTDTGAVDASPTWPAAEDINYYPGQETNFRIRFSVSNSNTTASGPFIPRISKNGAAYAAVTASSTNGVQSNTAASSSADAAAMATANFRLTAGVGTAFAGAYDNNGSTTLSMASGVFTELEYGFIIRSANVAPGDIIDWELYNSTTAFTTYSQIPRTCIPETPGSDFAAFHILGSTGSIVANQASIALTTVKAGNAGNLAVIAVACDNNQTTDGDEGAVTSVTDSVGGNTWTKAIEFCNGQGTAQAGATVSIWYSQLTNAIPVGTVITANFSNATSRDAAAITGKVWTLAAGKTLIVDGTATRADDGVDPGSLNLTTTNAECLRIRCTAMEYTGAVDITTAKTANWSPWQRGIGSTGTSTTSMSVYGESIITVGTGGASDPTIAAADCASAYVAFRLAGANQTLTGTKYTEAADSFGTALKVNRAITGVKYSEAADTFGVPVVGRGVRTIVGVKFSDTPDSFGVPVVIPDQRLTGTKFSDTPDSFGVPVVTQTAVSDVVIYITSGTSFSVPSDCYWAKSVEAIAGGGSGGAGDTSVGARGGGGGGAYSRLNNKPTFTSPGASVTVQIGAGGVGTSGNGLTGGDTWFVVTGLLLAKGGEGGTTGARALGGDQNAGVGDIRWSGGQGGQPSVGNWSGGGGGPGGNFNQFFGGNGNNTTGSVNSGGGGGGGVNGVGTAGSPSTGDGGLGGLNRFSVNASFGTSAARNGAGGTDGGGGGGAGSDGTNTGFAFGGLGGDGTEWEATYGIGGGGGGGGYGGGGGNGGFYGGGGGGGGYNPSAATFAGYGKVGVIRFVYTPGSLIATKGLTATRFTNTNRIYYPTTSGGAEVRVYIYSTASFTVPSDCPVAQKIRAIGAGGAGGQGGSLAGSAGGGGGGGAYAEGQNISLTPGAVVTVNLGIGGTTSIPGNAGGSTYFGGTDFASSLVFAEGGKGGAFGASGTAGYPGMSANSKGIIKHNGGYGNYPSSPGKWSGGGGGGAGHFINAGVDGGNGGSSDSSTQGGGGGGGGGGFGPAGAGQNTGAGGAGGTNFNNSGSGAGGTSSSRNGGDGSLGGGGGGSGSNGVNGAAAGKGGDGIELGGYGIGGAAGGSGGGGGGGGVQCTGGQGGMAGGGGGGSGYASSFNPVGGDGGYGYLSLVYVPVSLTQTLTAKRYVHEYNYLIGAEPGNLSELASAGGIIVQGTIKHSGSYAFKSVGVVVTPGIIKLP